MIKKVRTWKAPLIEDFKSQWRKAMSNRIESEDGGIFRVRSNQSSRLYSVNREQRTCTCSWGRYPLANDTKSGCSHVVTVLTHWANEHDWKVKMAPRHVPRYREIGEFGSGEADGQILLGHGVKLLLFKIPKGYRINQLGGMTEPVVAYKPDTVEDLAALRDRLEVAQAQRGPNSMEARRLQARITALEMQEPPSSNTVQDKSSAVGVIEESEDPSLVEEDHRPLVWAKSYLRHGFSIGKLTLRNQYPKEVGEDWLKFRDHAPSVEQVSEWWGKDDQEGRMCIFPGYGGLYVFDFNVPELHRRWQHGVKIAMGLLGLDEPFGHMLQKLGVVLTGGGGYHVYMRTEEPPLGGKILAEGVKGYGYGGHMVAPPSKHESGTRYYWATDYRTIPTVPPQVFELMVNSARQLND